MELRQLAYFVAVADEGSFTRAAAREHVAQPGVSAQIAKLEAELGERLFLRRPQDVRLTAAGEAILPFARAALAGAAGVRASVEALAGVIAGQLVIGVVPSVGGWLAGALAAFHERHPEVEVSLQEGLSEALVDGVREGALDVALAGLAGMAPRGLQARTVVEEALVAAVSHEHPLARRRAITVAELGRERLIALPRGTGGRAALEAGLASAGASGRVALEAGDPVVLMELARRGLGVAVVPASAPEDLWVISIRPALRSRLDLLWRSAGEESPAARAFIALALELPLGPGPQRLQ
jgi:DNA-binding transcriptional LysR family regulator